MTSKTHKFRPSPALVIACIALFMAMTGSALAIGKNTVRSPQIVNGAVKTVDLGRNAVRGGKIANGTVSAFDLGTDSVGPDEIAKDAVDSDEVAKDAIESDEIADNAVASSEVAPDSLNAGDLAANAVGSSELQANSVRGSELAPVNIRTASEAIASGANGAINVSCAAGEQVLSGGGQPGHFGVEMTSTRPSGNGWLYQARNNTGGKSTITVYAVCLAA